MENYLQVLEEGLRKKLDVLCKIEVFCTMQESILSAERVSEEEFEKSIEEKDMLIKELEKLDDGFEALYAHIKEQLAIERQKYKPQISMLQKQITEVTEKSMAIQAQEARNRKLAEKYFTKAKQELKKGRRSSKAALDYYRSMNQSQMVSPQFKKKKK